MPDVQKLIASAAQDKPPTSDDKEKDTTKKPETEQQLPEGQQPEVVPSDDEITQIGLALAEMMRADPQLALQIADLIDKKEGGMQNVEGLDGFDMGMGAPMQGAPTEGMAPQAPHGMPQMGPSMMGSAMPPEGQAGIPPELMARLEMLERAHADQEVERELARIGHEYRKLREHFGDVLPEQHDEKAILQLAYDIMNGRNSPFDLALAKYIIDTATGGEGTLRDRILASAAEKKGKPVPVEGRGGGIAAGEAPQKPKTASDVMKRAKQIAEAMFGGGQL